ncbi:glycosyltransferase family 4 protein [Sagittula sp. MA-2]|uniref:glycosyltransferase family 4 protein n=1 Tax=Sagittula sp. MA-2 TaxID=3048007 RepID=UPI0024C36577|nr:glycosyltransferase family 4 protein [Sagittula sp. MA-2]WHZ33265.1 glycosyltransferase family 4 protein [Sagittula sp. MA-2]
MRLAYIARSELPSESANSVHVMRMCLALLDAGADVRLFALKGGTGDSSPEGLARYYGARRPVPMQLYDRSNPFTGGGWRMRAVLSARLARRSVLTRDIHVAVIAARFGISTVLELHHAPHKGSRGERDLGRALAKGVRIVTITSALADHIAGHWPVSREHIAVLQDGADVVGSITPEGTLDRGRPVAGYVGSLLPGKGAELVCELAGLVPEADVVVIGGPEKRRLELAHGAPANLRVLPRVSPSSVAAQIAALDVALLPNARNVSAEGGADIGAWTSPLKAFEYMALGRAILASDLPNLREVFEDGRNALLCPPDEPEVWAQRLRDLLSDETLRSALGAAAKSDLERNYSWAVRARKMLELMSAAP